MVPEGTVGVFDRHEQLQALATSSASSCGR